MKKYLLYLVLTFTLYHSAVHLGFAQDDFFFLLLSRADSFLDVLKFFSPWHQGSFPFYRPLGTQLYFFSFTSLFGTHAPLAMHLFMLAVHAGNVYQLEKLLRRLHFSSLSAFLGALLYLSSATHFLSLVYLSATQHLLATTFSLLSLRAFLAMRPLATALFFLLALLSKESALVLPLIAILFSWYQNKSLFSFRSLLHRLFPYMLLFTVYCLLRFGSGVVLHSEYIYTLDMRVFTTLRFYIMYLFGWFEKIPDYLFPSQLPLYLSDTHLWGYLTLAGSFLSLPLILFGLWRSSWRRLGLAVVVIFMGLLLYLGLPTHLFPHYLDYSLFGFIFFLLSLRLSRPVLVILTGFIILANIGGIGSSFRLHWSPLRAKLNQAVLPILLSRGLCQHHQVIIGGDVLLTKDLAYSLSGDNGPSVICAHPLKVYYSGAGDSPLDLPIINLTRNDL